MAMTQDRVGREENADILARQVDVLIMASRIGGSMLLAPALSNSINGIKPKAAERMV